MRPYTIIASPTSMKKEVGHPAGEVTEIVEAPLGENGLRRGAREDGVLG